MKDVIRLGMGWIGVSYDCSESVCLYDRRRCGRGCVTGCNKVASVVNQGRIKGYIKGYVFVLEIPRQK